MTRAVNWLRDHVGLRPTWNGRLIDDDPIRRVLSLALARHSSVEYTHTRDTSAVGGAYRVYCSEIAESACRRAILALGLPTDALVAIPTDDQRAMRVDALERAIQHDHRARRMPVAVISSVGGATSPGIDPVARIAAVAQHAGCWLHVDAAHGGVAAIVPELRYLWDGIDGADSLTLRPHDWFVASHHATLLYLNHVDGWHDTGRPRGSRSLAKLVDAIDADSLAGHVRDQCEMAREFAGMVHFDGAWELTAPVPLSLVSFRYAPAGVSDIDRDQLNAMILSRVRARGIGCLAQTRIGETSSLQLLIRHLRTTRAHVDAAWRELRDAASAAHVSHELLSARQTS